MYNYVTRVFVGKASGAVSSAQVVGQPLDLALVQVGDLYLLSEDGLVLDAASAATATTARVVRGTSPGKFITSSDLKKKVSHSTKYTFQAYQAPVAQVSTFANLALSPNTDYKLQVVVQQDLPLISNRQDKIEVYHTTGANVSVADVDAIVRKFNTQRKGLQSIIKASTAGTTGITLTGQPVLGAAIDDYSFVRFETNFLTLSLVNASTGKKELLLSATAVQPSSETKAQGGQGTAIQLRAMERVSLGNFGFTDPRATWYKGEFPYGAVNGVGYDLYNVQQLLRGEYMFQDDKAYPHSTVVAVASGSAQKTAFGTVLDAFISGQATTPPQGE